VRGVPPRGPQEAGASMRLSGLERLVVA